MDDVIGSDSGRGFLGDAHQLPAAAAAAARAGGEAGLGRAAGRRHEHRHRGRQQEHEGRNQHENHRRRCSPGCASSGRAGVTCRQKESDEYLGTEACFPWIVREPDNRTMAKSILSGLLTCG